LRKEKRGGKKGRPSHKYGSWEKKKKRITGVTGPDVKKERENKQDTERGRYDPSTKSQANALHGYGKKGRKKCSYFNPRQTRYAKKRRKKRRIG